MAYNEIITELRAKLGDDYAKNMEILRNDGDRFAAEGNLDGVRAVGELVLEIMPEDQKAEVNRLTHIDGVRLDEMYNTILEHINKNEYMPAKSLAEKLYKKIVNDYAETEKSAFVSLRNPFEDNLYQILFKPEKTLNRAPFDFSTYLTTYAFILVETGSTIDAVPILEKAMEFNPVDCGPKFELTEIYKITKNRKKVIELTKETLKVASSPIAIARCYANMGYALTDAGEFEDAVAFYTASSMMAPNPAIAMEMNHIKDLKGSPIPMPSNDKIEEVMKKYGIATGANRDVVAVAAQLASHYLMKKDIPNALQALKLTYNLTADEEVKKLILKYDPKAATLFPKTDGNGNPNITVSRNEN